MDRGLIKIQQFKEQLKELMLRKSQNDLRIKEATKEYNSLECEISYLRKK